MTPENYRERLGGLVGNFHALEFVLRCYFQALPTARPIGISYGTDIYSFPVGAEVPENELTSYDSLGSLIQRFNGDMQSRGAATIDPTLVRLRDAIAHGRVSTKTKDGTLRLLKFGKPKEGKITIEFNEKMTEEWFKVQIPRVFSAVAVVAHVMGASTEPLQGLGA